MSKDMSKRAEYEPMTVAGIAMLVKKEETIYVAKSAKWHGFIITAHNLDTLADKLPEAMREYEEFVAGGDRDLEVIKAFAKFRDEQEACAVKNVGTNKDPERIMTLRAVKLLLGQLWPHTFATGEEMAMFNSRWDFETDRMVKEMEQDDAKLGESHPI